MDIFHCGGSGIHETWHLRRGDKLVSIITSWIDGNGKKREWKKPKQLRLTVERTGAILGSGKSDAIQRHQDALKATASEADDKRRSVETLKIAAKENLDSIGTRNLGIDAELAKADDEVERLQEWRDDYRKRGEGKRLEEQLIQERELHEARMKFNSDLQAAKTVPEKQPKSETSHDSVLVKLPKLTITEFNGSYQDWPRFWCQFVETIDKTGIPSFLKFTYLRELLELKVRKTVEALPFTSEGYNRAKSILQDRYGNEAEIVKAYIFDLPTITNVNIRKIHEFNDKLTYAVQSLETMKKLGQINGNMAMTLDTLPAIRGDLVRTDSAWESWNFLKLTEALRLWTRRNPIDRRSQAHSTTWWHFTQKRQPAIKSLSRTTKKPTALATVCLLWCARPQVVELWNDQHRKWKKGVSCTEETLLQLR